MEPPVLAVYVKVVVPASCIRVSHQALYVSGEDFSNHSILAVAVAGPGIVLTASHVDVFEFIGAFVFEQGEPEL